MFGLLAELIGFNRKTLSKALEKIRRMEQEQNKLEVLRTAIRAGDKQLDHGKGVLLTDALMEEIENNAIKRHKKGKKPNADVTA